MKSTKTVLVVEDDHALLSALVAKLEHEHFVVIQAHDGEEGLEAARTGHPDLILLDIIMPKMDGLTMLQNLRADPNGKSVPVLVLSNLETPDKAMEALKNKATDYLTKSDWTLDDIVKRIREVLE